MKSHLWLIAAVLFLCATDVARAARGEDETWHSLGGTQVTGRLVTVFGPLAFIASSERTGFVPLEAMTDDELQRVAQFLDTAPTRVSWAASNSPVAKALRHRLQIVRGNKLAVFEMEQRPEPDIYLAYFSASWCGPCHRFTPELIKKYRELQALAPGRIEVILLSADEDARSAAAYAIDAGMPWPVLDFGDRGRVRPLEQWEADGIPNLVAVTRSGDVIFHSYRGKEYLGPDDVLEKVSHLLALLDPASAEYARGRHRLAVLERQRKAGAADCPPEGYWTQLTKHTQELLPAEGVTVELEVDEQGKVTDTQVNGDSFSPLAGVLSPETSNWLFLPAIHQGRPATQSIKVVLKRAG